LKSWPIEIVDSPFLKMVIFQFANCYCSLPEGNLSRSFEPFSEKMVDSPPIEIVDSPFTRGYLVWWCSKSPHDPRRLHPRLDRSPHVRGDSPRPGWDPSRCSHPCAGHRSSESAGAWCLWGHIILSETTTGDDSSNFDGEILVHEIHNKINLMLDHHVHPLFGAILKLSPGFGEDNGWERKLDFGGSFFGSKTSIRHLRVTWNHLKSAASQGHPGSPPLNINHPKNVNPGWITPVYGCWKKGGTISVVI